MAAILPTGPIGHILDVIASLQRLKLKKAGSFNMLTSREREVLVLIAEGYSNPKIAKRLNLSRITVQNHRANIRQKLNITSDADYVKLALAFDLIRL